MLPVQALKISSVAHREATAASVRHLRLGPRQEAMLPHRPSSPPPALRLRRQHLYHLAVRLAHNPDSNAHLPRCHRRRETWTPTALHSRRGLASLTPRPRSATRSSRSSQKRLSPSATHSYTTLNSRSDARARSRQAARCPRPVPCTPRRAARHSPTRQSWRQRATPRSSCRSGCRLRECYLQCGLPARP